ncbi:hypothetical protein [Mariluticola halotolerans]|uniref:hypothetical protein n=1 Tax=Mariluticola halotolerans TaxID=2909283 RepID=UPI0026E3FE62|nr:hypothetical protein [Mariluticola halotolerans]UJQ93352.1 hypothetical protein L1P08_10115 [Mariluticola halotolerans]
MAKKVIRDNAYYLKRIETEHPAVWADWKSGKFKSVNEARRAAGMITERTPLHELKNAWGKASRAEQQDFLSWLRLGAASLGGTSAASPIALNAYLQPWAKKRIEEIFATRGLKMGDVMDEMGFERLNPSLGMALNRDSSLRPAMIAALEKWIADNASV